MGDKTMHGLSLLQGAWLLSGIGWLSLGGGRWGATLLLWGAAALVGVHLAVLATRREAPND